MPSPTVSSSGASSSTKHDIITSLFSRRSAADGSLDEAYVAHVKIFEDDVGEVATEGAAAGGGGVKARYLMLAGASPLSCRQVTDDGS